MSDEPLGGTDQNPSPTRRRRDPVAGAVGALGEILLTLGAVVALFVVYQVWWTDIASAQKQSEAESVLEEEWTNPRGGGVRPEEGVAFARMYVPAFGSDYRFAVVSGTDEASLEVGPGHYPDSQQPGRPGNFAIAGHRVGRGAPFNDLDAIRGCDAVVYETATEWYVYRVLPIDAPDRETARTRAAECMDPGLADRVTSGLYEGLSGLSVVLPENIEVIDPVPGKPDRERPDLLPLTTLTTCHPQYSATERMVVHAVLVRAEPRVPGRVPAELEG